MEGGINNPSIFLFPNGTSLVAARTCTCPKQAHVHMTRAGGRGERAALARALQVGRTWPGFWRIPQPFSPFLWSDIRGHMRMLLHHQDGDANQLRNGAHAYSRDGVSWTWSPSIAYTTEVAWEGDTRRGACRPRC